MPQAQFYIHQTYVREWRTLQMNSVLHVNTTINLHLGYSNVFLKLNIGMLWLVRYLMVIDNHEYASYRVIHAQILILKKFHSEALV